MRSRPSSSTLSALYLPLSKVMCPSEYVAKGTSIKIAVLHWILGVLNQLGCRKAINALTTTNPILADDNYGDIESNVAMTWRIILKTGTSALLDKREESLGDRTKNPDQQTGSRTRGGDAKRVHTSYSNTLDEYMVVVFLFVDLIPTPSELQYLFSTSTCQLSQTLIPPLTHTMNATLHVTKSRHILPRHGYQGESNEQ
uniref:Uncharacterized protein n=1 Tax=Moniliophthora roreri TaxID=221103 RepID=A0A0W0FN53_MONRR